jgi:hypothetical protein
MTTISTPDGRRLEVALPGPGGGTPIILHHALPAVVGRAARSWWGHRPPVNSSRSGESWVTVSTFLVDCSVSQDATASGVAAGLAAL